MTRENSKCRGWEKERRHRLNEAFSALAKVLPCYDPCVNICKIDILTRAQSTIKDQQDELNKITFTKGDNKNITGEVLKRFQYKIRQLISRNEQLRDLLRASGISIPKCIRTFQVKNNRFKKASSEQAEMFQKKEMEKENQLAQGKKKKAKSIKASLNLKRPKTDSKCINKLPPKKRKTSITSTAAPCVLVLPQPSITAGFLISNQQITPTKRIPSAIGMTSTFPFINPQLSLGPGTLLLANGTMVPIFPKQQVVISNQQVISSNSVTISKTISQPVDSRCEKSLNQGNNSRPIKPKYCVTNTTQINKLPIPALTSSYANNQSLLNDGFLIIENSKEPPKKSKHLPKDKTNRVIKRMIRIPSKLAIKKHIEDICVKVSNKNEIINESEITVSKESMKMKSSEINTPQLSILTTSTDKMGLIDVSSSSSSSTNQDNQKINNALSIEENKDTTNLEKMSGNTEQDKGENDSRVTDRSSSETMDISHSEENLIASSAPCDDNVKNLDLNLVHSELSNDIFASLHVPPGCQNPESTSPTAAFLMAFPLVSSVKATDVIDDDHSSQRQTPTLLQIGTMDSTKHTHSDNLAGSLLNLDSFSFFNSKDVCENYYESCTNNLSKENQMSRSELKNKVECVNVDRSVATSESSSIENVLSNCDSQNDDPKTIPHDYNVFHDNHKANVDFNLSEKVSYEVYNGVKRSIDDAHGNKRVENGADKSSNVSNIVENDSCNAYPELLEDCRNKKNVENELVTTEDTSKKTEQVYSGSMKPNNYEKNQNTQDICYQDTKMKETRDYITCQESRLKSNSDKDILKTNPYNIYQEKSKQTVMDSNNKLHSGDDEISCNYNQQCINASKNNIRIDHTSMYNDKDGSSVSKKSSSNYELRQNIVSQDDIYKSFHNNISGDVSEKKNTGNNANANSFIYPNTGIKSSEIQCSAVIRNFVDMPTAIMEKPNTHLYSVDSTSFNNFQNVKSIQRIDIESCEKSPVNNKLTENIAFNIFETTHTANKKISSSGNADNSNLSGKLFPTAQHQNYKKDVNQKSTGGDKSQCYYSTTYPDSSYNINYKNDGTKLCATCSYMNLNKSYSNPLYTNSANYNYYPDNNVTPNYYKTSTQRTDTKSYYSLNYENYQEYKKSEGHNSIKCHGSSSTILRDKSSVDQTNAAKEKCVPQNKLVNWMTTPENKAQNSDAFLTFPNQSYSFASCVSGEANDINTIFETKKHLDISLLTEDKQFSWSQSKLPNFLDQTHNFVTPTLPTLVGDLALGNALPFTDQKNEYKYPKDQKRKNNAYDNQSNFLSVSQLVDHNKTENMSSRITTRRSSGGRSKNTSQMKNKRPAKNESNDKIGQIKPANIYNTMISNRVFNDQKSGNHIKNTSSSYSAEALIGNQIPDTSKKYPSNSSKPMGSSRFLTENIITCFPTIEENYINQNQNFQNIVYTHNSFQTTNQSAISTNSFVYTTPTITSTYLSSNFEAPCYEFTDNLNVLAASAVRDNKLSNIKINKQSTNSKDDKNISYFNSIPKKSKKKIGNESINSGFSNFEFPLLPMPGSTNSPILPDDFHTHTSFLPPTAPYPAKTSMYQKQGNDFTPNGLLPIPGLPRNNTQHNDVSPLNSVGTTLTNFNLSTIFPEINKGNMSNVYLDHRNKEHSSSLQMPFNLDPKYTFSG